MNYTTNYHLPQWVESDRILMEDFNGAMSDIDGGIKEAKDAASVAQTAAESAQSTANTAESKADAAQSTANNAYCPDNKPYVIGTYTGNGYGTQTITIGFPPSIAIISGEVYTTEEVPGMQYTVIATASSPNMVYSTTDTGFTVHMSGSYKPLLNTNGRKYRYIAFR